MLSWTESSRLMHIGTKRGTHKLGANHNRCGMKTGAHVCPRASNLSTLFAVVLELLLFWNFLDARTAAARAVA